MLSIAKGYDPDYLLNEVAKGAEHYYLKAIEVAGEPPGVWAGRGLEALGLEAGAEVDADDMRLLFKEWADPRAVKAAMNAAEAEVEAEGLTGARAAKFLKDAKAAAIESARLGTNAYKFTPVEERIEKALAAEPYADERRRAEIERQVRKTQRQAVKFYDLTYNASKSFSVLHAAFQVEAQQAEAAGDTKAAELARWKAEQVWAAIQDGNDAQLEYLQDVAGFTRAGHHTKSIEGRTVGRYVKADGWIIASFRQHTNRNDDPHLHIHNTVVAKVEVTEIDPVTGEERKIWRAIDGQAIYRHLGAAGAHGDRVASESLMRRIEGVRFEMRPDGKAREIVGIGQELRDRFSSRRRQVDAGVAELVKAYEEKHGRTPGVHQVAKMAQYVTLNSRQGKKKQAPSRAELLDRWEAQATDELKQSLTGVTKQVVGGVFRRGHTQAQAFDPAEVTARAVRAIQAQKAKWTRADLRVEIDKALPDCLGGLTAEQLRGLVDELVETAVRPGAGQVEVVSLMPPPVIEMPEQMLAEASYDAAGIEKFATVEHLRREEKIVEATRTQGAPTVAAEIVEQVIASAGLNEAQARAVRGITQSGRLADVLIGPAGTGKSRTVAALCEIWEKAGLPAPMGLATSQRAADVLAEEGVERVANLTRFLKINARIAKGEFVSLADRQAYEVQPGAPVIVDEAGMADTIDINKVIKIAERAGGQVLIAGDHGQVTAVGAGGMLHQLVGDAEPYVLDEVVRFAAEWERDASLRVRAGDASVLAEYERQARIEGGTAEEMADLAYQRWLADHLDGKQSLLIASTNKVAGDLAMRARTELVRLGKVEAEGVELGLNEDVHQVAGVGDLVALRKNNRRMRAAGGKKKHWATNRDVVTVVGRNSDGSLRVRYDDGATMTLSSRYVRRHVELAYAGTVHSAQGRTVQTCHSLVAEGITREQLYVMLTRGQAANHAYVECEPTGAKTPSGEYVIPDAHTILSDALARSEVEYSATTTLRREMDRAENLAVVGRMWEDLQIRVAHPRYASALANAITAADWDRLYGTDSYQSLIRLARHVDEQGHDAAAMLAETAAARSFAGVDDVGKVMFTRLETVWKRAEQARAQAAKQAGRDGEPQRWRTYAERTPQVAGPEGEAMRQAAEVMDARRAELGRRTAEQAPAWATEQLGPVPEDALEREEWVTRAGVIAGYREAHGYESDRDAIGAAPPKGAVEARAAWEDAWRALGQPDERRDVAKLSDLELTKAVERHDRELSWAPPNVDTELQTARRARDDYAARAVLRRAEAEAETDPARREELGKEAEMLGGFAAAHTDRAAKLDNIAKAYDRWHDHTRPVREQATMAREELDRRRPQPEPEQQAEAKPKQDEPTAEKTRQAEPEKANAEKQAPQLDDLSEATRAAERALRILKAHEHALRVRTSRAQAERNAEYARRQQQLQQRQPTRDIRGPEIGR